MELEETVDNFWTPNIGWNWRKIGNKLLEEVVRIMKAYQLVKGDEETDIMYWSAESSGTFSICSAYKLTCDRAGMVDDGIWEKIRKIRAPNKMRAFLWLARHQCIMCNVERKWRKFNNNDHYHNCPGEIEDVDHVSRRCRKVVEVWKRTFPAMVNKPWWKGDFAQWMEKNIKAKETTETLGDWNTTFTTTAWWI